MGMKRVLAVGLMMMAVASPLTAQGHGNGQIEVPLRVDGGRLLVPVEAADGTEVEFVLSTGTPQTVFSESTAARLGDQALTLGGVPVNLDGSVTVPDEALTADGFVLAGMIAPNTLSDFDVLIDAPGGRLVLKPIGPRVAWEGVALSDPLRVQVYHGVFLSFGVELDGTEYKAMLDLGLSTLVVNEPVKAALGLETESTGTLVLGDTTLSDLPVRVRDLALFRGWDPDGDGFVVVGAPVSHGCVITISWVHREIRTCVR